MKTLLWEKNPTPTTPQRLRQQMWETARQITLVLEGLIKGISHHSHAWSKGEKSFKPKSASLTPMLLVANLANTKWCKKPEIWLKPWHMGAHLRVPSKSYPMNTNTAGFKWFSKNFVIVLSTKVASALEGLIMLTAAKSSMTILMKSCRQSI